MTKRLLAMVLSITLIICSTLPSLAQENNVQESTADGKIVEQLKSDLGVEKAEEILGKESFEDSNDLTSVVSNDEVFGESDEILTETTGSLNESSQHEQIYDSNEELEDDLVQNENEEEPEEDVYETQVEEESGEEPLIEDELEESTNSTNNEGEVENTNSNEEEGENTDAASEESEASEVVEISEESKEISDAGVRDFQNSLEEDNVAKSDSNENADNNENVSDSSIGSDITSENEGNKVDTADAQVHNTEEVENNDTSNDSNNETNTRDYTNETSDIAESDIELNDNGEIATESEVKESLDDLEDLVATISDITLKTATNSEAVFGDGDPWMWWYLTDDGHTIHYTSTEPASGGHGISSIGVIDYSQVLNDWAVTRAVVDNIINIQTCNGLFYDFRYLEEIDNISNFNTSNVTDMSNMFCQCKSLTTIDVSSFDTRNVTDMSGMFSSCGSLTTIDVSNFNTSNVTDMSYMFDCDYVRTKEEYIHNLQSIIGIENFDTSNVQNMSSMFSASSLTNINLNNFNTSNVIDMSKMFNGCSSLTTIDASSFNTSNVTNMGGMLDGCSSLTTLDLSSFDTSNVTDMSKMFSGCSSLTTIDASSFNTSNVTNMGGMFHGCSSLTTLDLSSFNTSNVTSMAQMFWICSSLTNIDVSSFDTSNVTSMVQMFSDCSSLTTLDLSRFDTSNVTTMSSMFWNCSSLTTLDLSRFNTSNVTNMHYIFRKCSSLTTLDLSSFDTSNVTNMEGMFGDCSSLTTLDVSSFNTGNVTRMFCMFSGCSSLISLDLSGFDTSNVTELGGMGGMFDGCSSLTTLDLNSFDTSKVRNMNGMFDGCLSLTTLDLSSFDTSNVVGMDHMFLGCTNLNNIKVSDKFVTDQVREGSNMFGYNFDGREESDGCISLVGGNGTVFSYNHIDKEYARIDKPGAPGYFTEADLGNLISVAIDTLPTKTSYLVGEKFNPTGIKILAIYDSGIRRTISYTSENKSLWSFTPSLNTNLAISNTSIALTYNGISSNNIEIQLKQLNSVVIKTKPTRLNYAMGQKLNPAGLILTLSYSIYSINGNTTSSENVEYNENNKNKFTFSDSVLNSSKNIIVTYNNNKGNNLNPTFPVVVKQVASISVINRPTKITYNRNEKLNPDGLALKVNYLDNTSENIVYSTSNADDFTFNPSLTTNLTTSHNTVTITYGGKTTTFAISVTSGGSSVVPSGGSRGGSSGGGGGGGGMPAASRTAPETSYISVTKTISGSVDSATSRWVSDPITGKWKLNVMTSDGGTAPLSNGFYQVNYNITQVINNISVPTVVNNTYYFDESGNMVTGWIKTGDNKWFFFDNAKTSEEGKMAIGWKQVENAWYYFTPDGSMMENGITPDGFMVGADGRWIQQ